VAAYAPREGRPSNVRYTLLRHSSRSTVAEVVYCTVEYTVEYCSHLMTQLM